jgi:hypothetical protein
VARIPDDVVERLKREVRVEVPPHGIDAVQDAQKRRLRRLRGGLGPAGGKGERVCMAYPPRIKEWV